MVSVIIPVFNERQTIETIVERVQKNRIPMELIIVDDGSTDGTRAWLQKRFGSATNHSTDVRNEEIAVSEATNQQPQVRVFFLKTNQGKGAALRVGFREAKGKIVLVQDADLEYDPKDYSSLLQPIYNDQADVVYGSRFLGDGVDFWPRTGYFANKAITTFSNVVSGLSLTDVWTGYKVINKKVLDELDLNESGFELEMELTAKIARGRWRICEVPISYSPRTKAQGKKIRWIDGLKAIRCIIRNAKRSKG